MFFLCSPQLLFPIFVHDFIGKSWDLLQKGAIREDIYKNLLKEKKWVWGFLGIFGLYDVVLTEEYSYLMCMVMFFPFVILWLAFPIYFTFNFIFFFLNKKKYHNEEGKLLLSFYGFPTFFIIILGFIFKFVFHVL